MNAKTAEIFAVKKLNFVSPTSGVDKVLIQKLKKEIDIYRKLEHPNIISYIGSEIVDQKFCIYLEYASGGSLESVYNKYGAFPERMIKQYLKQILAGLAYLHEKRVVHCDLKGANLLLDANGAVKLGDFGCSEAFETSQSMSVLKGQVRGSLPWMAPEVLVNKSYGRRADIWSLGCTILELLNGGNPWGDI